MEGGSPHLIWERWDIPMYRTQCRYWSDHPTIEALAAAYLGIKPRKTPPPKPVLPGEEPARPNLDWSLLDE